MSSYVDTRIDLYEFEDELKYKQLPIVSCDMSLAFHLGIKNKTLWWAVLSNAKLYTTFRIPKRGHQKNSYREIQNPERRLKYIQRALLGKFLEPFPVGKHIGAYIPGRSCMYTAAQHTNKKMLISMDISDFFPSVKRSMVRRVFSNAGYSHLVSSMLSSLVCYKNFVPQGAPTSGLVANLVANMTFDREILIALRRLDSRWVYTRYSDDIDLSHPSKQSHEQVCVVIEMVTKAITRAGFRVNSSKTRVDPYCKQQKVLGAVVNERINIPRLEYARLRSLIHNCLMHGLETQYTRSGCSDVGTFMSYITGKLSYLKQLNKEKATLLQDRFDIAIGFYEQLQKDKKSGEYWDDYAFEDMRTAKNS